MKQRQYLRVVSAFLLVCALFLQGCTKQEATQFKFIETTVNGVRCYSLKTCDLAPHEYEIVIPEIWEGLPVLCIEKYAFTKSALTQSVDIGAVEIISPAAFQFCSQLRQVNLRNVKIIGEGAFAGLGYLTSIVIPATVEEIGRTAFADCTSLRTIYFEGDPSVLGEQIFPGYAVIFGKPGGHVEEYAKKYGKEFVPWEPASTH